MAHADQPHPKKVDRHGENLRGQDLSGADLEGVDLSGADLEEANLSHANLKGADLRNARLVKADLTHANLSGANIRGARFTNANMTGVILHGVRSANLVIGPLWPTKILRYIYLWRVPIFTAFGLSALNLLVLGSWKIPWAIATLVFGGVGLVAKFRASLQNAAEQGADFTEANLSGADLSDADLSGAEFRRAILVQADLSRANLIRAGLREANITCLAAVRDADLRQAEVGSAGLQLANRSRVKGVSAYTGMKGPPLPPAAVLQYIYLLRVPILLGLALFFLPIISLWTSARALLGNLFVLGSLDIYWAIFSSLVLAFSILVTFRVVLLNGMERFGIQQALTQDRLSPFALLLTELLVVPMFLGAVFSNGQAETTEAKLIRLAFAAAGFLAAHIVGFTVLLVAVLFSQQYPVPADERFPLPFKWMKKLLKKAYAKEWASRDRLLKWGNWFKGLALPMRAGYFDPDTGLIYPGQLLSFVLLLVTIVLYWRIGSFKHARLGQEPIPAICYVLLLLLLLNWILSMTAFFLDRYRIPLLTLLALLIWRGNVTPQSDHYYATRPGNPIAVSPKAVLGAASRFAPDGAHPRGRVVLVATEGGGIQAAAWTAEVLTGLQRQLQNSPARVNFADSIALISSVSGGAVGSMFFARRYQDKVGSNGFTTADKDLEAIVDAAEKPSLDDVAWGLAYPDFWRVFFPYTKSAKGRLVDRGAALEQAWSYRGGGIYATLNTWRKGVLEGRRPALIFNATQVETGAPLLLATTDMPPQIPTFSSSAPNSDISVVTAVRLAASFPYVSPAAKSESEKPLYHVVDGGYYDNYGLYSLLEWLNDALTASSTDKTPDILIIQIRSFPSSSNAPSENRGWFYQVWAPLQALMEVRTTAQSVRNTDALKNFIDLWSSRGFHISQTTFEFPGTDAPLSWSMNAAQIQDIKDNWRDQISPDKKPWITVNCFFNGGNTCANSQTPQAGAN